MPSEQACVKLKSSTRTSWRAPRAARVVWNGAVEALQPYVFASAAPSILLPRKETWAGCDEISRYHTVRGCFPLNPEDCPSRPGGGKRAHRSLPGRIPCTLSFWTSSPSLDQLEGRRACVFSILPPPLQASERRETSNTEPVTRHCGQLPSVVLSSGRLRSRS